MSRATDAKLLSVPLRAVRRLAVVRQHLAGPLPRRPGASALMDVMKDIRYLQLDPISAVAQSHLLVLFARVGRFDATELDRLLWRERKLFEYWAHVASIVLTEDFPLFRHRMTDILSGNTPRRLRVRAWMRKHQALRKFVISELRSRGPLLSRQFQDPTRMPPTFSAWSEGRAVSEMLTLLQHEGKISVAGRDGKQKVWDLAERSLLPFVPDREISREDMMNEGTMKSLHALGVASPKQVAFHFLIGMLRNTRGVLSGLEKEGRVEQIRIEGQTVQKGPWYVEKPDLPVLERLSSDDWEPRTVLLSPFDNLIIDRERTEQLFGFKFRTEIYNKKHNREFGYYVLPILHGDRFIGRIDPKFDRASETLHVHAVHAEKDAPEDRATAEAVSAEVQRLAEFIGSRRVVYAKNVPPAWSKVLR